MSGQADDAQQPPAQTVAFYSPTGALAADPPPDLVQHLVALYISQVTSQISFFTLGWFHKELVKGGTSRAFIYAIMAMACRLYSSVIAGVDVAAMEGAMTDRAAVILARDTSAPTLSTVLAAMMLQTLGICNGNTQAAGRYHYKSLRLLKLLDVHTPMQSEQDTHISEEHPDWDEVETRRRVWWFAYMLDRCLSVATGNQPYLDQQKSRVLFPVDEVDLERSVATNDEPLGADADQAGRKPSSPYQWRARVLQILELQLDIVRITNQLRDDPHGASIADVCHELNRITAIFNRMGGHERSLDTMDRLCRLTMKLNTADATGDTDDGTRILKAYKVLFRVFAHCQHRAVQIALGRAKLSLLDLDSTDIRESIVHGALEIAQLTRLIPDDLLCCMNAYHSYAVGMAGFVFSDVANGPDDDYWPGVSRVDAVSHLQTLVACLTQLSHSFRSLVARRDMLQAMMRKAQARLAPALYGSMAQQEIITTLPPALDSSMLSSQFVRSMSTSILGTNAKHQHPVLSMPTDENSQQQ
ncbi:fungal-specific transcription factor domain-containing protein [Syncephalis pseudoplumigaleata]|uniref:Fungal-specific transcription factor domain-containing protein n=1 Tax=Syncephalis pseudoplumigaleata TaxID=1712513 RepID=A0A4P9YUD0_9FUNG|nr:fungal-specific transcription factor domain-containing protein [Syncephalis pseudoplumigaleata]|eukprot:RKP23434.1 fungal-specific transcription factor domain-containing protein [Syncephalis pseudoplumigaleata]